VAPMVEMPRRHARQQDRRFTHLLPHTCRLGARQQENLCRVPSRSCAATEKRLKHV
jgi:hypothetical protein